MWPDLLRICLARCFGGCLVHDFDKNLARDSRGLQSTSRFQHRLCLANALLYIDSAATQVAKTTDGLRIDIVKNVAIHGSCTDLAMCIYTTQ